jgi:hypothetical protein
MNYTEIKDLIDNNNCSNKKMFNEKFNSKLNYILRKMDNIERELKLHNILVNKMLNEHNKLIDCDEEEEKLDISIENLKMKLQYISN